MPLRTGKAPNGFCNHCYGPLSNGECAFCSAFDEVIGR